MNIFMKRQAIADGIGTFRQFGSAYGKGVGTLGGAIGGAETSKVTYGLFQQALKNRNQQRHLSDFIGSNCKNITKETNLAKKEEQLRLPPREKQECFPLPKQKQEPLGIAPREKQEYLPLPKQKQEPLGIAPREKLPLFPKPVKQFYLPKPESEKVLPDYMKFCNQKARERNLFETAYKNSKAVQEKVSSQEPKLSKEEMARNQAREILKGLAPNESAPEMLKEFINDVNCNITVSITEAILTNEKIDLLEIGKDAIISELIKKSVKDYIYKNIGDSEAALQSQMHVNRLCNKLLFVIKDFETFYKSSGSKPSKNVLEAIDSTRTFVNENFRKGAIKEVIDQTVSVTVAILMASVKNMIDSHQLDQNKLLLPNNNGTIAKRDKLEEIAETVQNAGCTEDDNSGGGTKASKQRAFLTSASFHYADDNSEEDGLEEEEDDEVVVKSYHAQQTGTVTVHAPRDEVESNRGNGRSIAGAINTSFVTDELLKADKWLKSIAS